MAILTPVPKSEKLIKLNTTHNIIIICNYSPNRKFKHGTEGMPSVLLSFLSALFSNSPCTNKYYNILAQNQCYLSFRMSVKVLFSLRLPQEYFDDVRE
jgi:hypothetical protein